MERGRPISRRQLLAGAAAFSVIPRSALGGRRHVAPADRLNLAFIGVGSQGLRVMLNFLKHPDVQAVAVCDPVTESADYPQWGRSEFANAVHNLLEVKSGWEWLSPNGPIRLTRTMQSAAGVAGREPCRKIVDAWNAKRTGTPGSKGCRAYSDFRELLEKETDIDGVVVGTTDHLHAAVAVAAMRKGRHVYCQKPMAHDIYESRRMAEVAREKRVATQVAVGNAASEDTRKLCEWVWGGAIGPVRQVVNWSSRPFWPQALERPKETQAVPPGMDWDLWLGPAPERPFHPVYLPFVWRGWHDFGCGALGDMGCYSLDTIFRVLKLQSPTSVEASSSERYDETFPAASIVHWDFPARAEMPPVRLTWYDGGLMPPRPEALEPNQKLDKEGLLFVGDQGAILCGFTGANPRILPESRRQSFTPPAPTLPRSPGHEREWLDACKGAKAVPGARFEFSSVVTESLLLGNVALRAGERILWNPTSRESKELPAGDRLIRPDRRKGWEL